jgi:PKD repeat protein
MISNSHGASFNFTPDDNGTYVVSLTVTDDDGGVGTDTETITVTNVNPTATNNGPQAARQYSDFIVPVTVTATDPSVDTLPAMDGSSIQRQRRIPNSCYRGTKGSRAGWIC